ncbi:MAG: ATPase, partial [Gammaproteobacteria bacterium]|nr:ATPase [Gammaproteobacteria bacterium]
AAALPPCSSYRSGDHRALQRYCARRGSVPASNSGSGSVSVGALRSLVNASVLQRSVAKDEGYASRYKLGGFAQQFLSHVKTPDRQFVANVRSAMKRLRESIEESSKRLSYYKYDQFAIHWKHRDERTLSPKLLQALEMCRTGRFERALETVDSAMQMLPQFAEIRRIRAVVLRESGDFVGAREEYEACLELDPESHIGRYAFAQFLVTELEDCEMALNVIAPLLVGSPVDLPPKSIAALARQRLGQLREAASMYEDLLREIDSARPRVRIAIRDQAAETYRRLSEFDSRSRDDKRFREHISRALEIILDCVTLEGGADPKSHRRLNEILQEALSYALRAHDRGLAEEAFRMIRAAWDRLPLRLDANPSPARLLQEFGDMADCTWFAETVYSQDADAISGTSAQVETATSERLRGIISSISASGPYGFIKDNEGRRWFFHRNHMYDSGKWPVIQVGSHVEFAVGTNQKGECAIDVNLTSDGDS